MFFYASKILAFVFQPSSFTILMIILGMYLMTRTRRTKLGLRLATAGVCLLIICGWLPMGNLLILPLEQRFAQQKVENLHEPTGIILLGGGITASVSAAREQLAVNAAGDRLTEFLILAKRFPKAKLVFSGGSSAVIYKAQPESNGVQNYYQKLGLNPARLTLEDKSRNTYENALFTKNLVKPAPTDRWVLITSAFHMPRAVGCFRQVGFNVIPYPADYRTVGWQDVFTFPDKISAGLLRTDSILREWVGLAMYWITGRIPDLFPAPSN